MQEDVKEKGCLLDGFPRAPDQVTMEKKEYTDTLRNMEKGVSKDIASDISYTVHSTYTRNMQHKDSQEATHIIHWC